MSSRSIVSTNRQARVAGPGSRIRPLEVFLTFIVCACMVAATPSIAHAKKRVVVLKFSGPRAKSFERSVRAILKKKHAVVSNARYVKTARKLRAKRPTKRNVSRVARELSADGIIIGSIKKRGGRYQITIRVRAGADGEFTATIKAKTRRPKLVGATRRRLRSRLIAAIRKLPSLDDSADGDDDDDDDRRASASDDDDDDDDDDGGSRARGGDDDDDDDDSSRGRRSSGDDDDDDDDDDDGRGSRSKGDGGDIRSPLTDEERADVLVRGRGLEMLAGVSVMSRKLSFTVDADLGKASPRGYSGTPVASAYLLGELYPLAFNKKNRGATRNIGFTFVLDQVLKVESKLAYVDAMDMNQIAVLPTEQQRYGVGIVYRHNFGDSPDKPTLKFAFRYNRAKFIIDKTAAPTGVPVDIPNMDYTYFDPGVALRYPMSDKLALLADARFLLVTDTGEMQQTDQYGGASVTGFDVDVGFTYSLDARLFVRLGGRVIGVAYDFKGTGTETTDRDADPEQDVFGAFDRYLGGYATAGYLF